MKRTFLLVVLMLLAISATAQTSQNTTITGAGGAKIIVGGKTGNGNIDFNTADGSTALNFSLSRYWLFNDGPGQPGQVSIHSNAFTSTPFGIMGFLFHDDNHNLYPQGYGYRVVGVGPHDAWVGPTTDAGNFTGYRVTFGGRMFVFDRLNMGMATPAAPVVTQQGTTGTTTYSYRIVPISIVFNDTTPGASAVGTTTTGNATLSTTNFNRVDFSSIDFNNSGLLPQNWDIYRVAGGATQGKIGNVTIASGQLFFNDTGQVADGSSPPLLNNSAQIKRVAGNTGNLILDPNLQIGEPNTSVGKVTLTNATNSFTVTFQAPNSAASVTYTLPVNKGQPGQVLADLNGDGVLSWASVSVLLSMNEVKQRKARKGLLARK